MLARYPSPLVNIAHSCAILFVRPRLVIQTVDPHIFLSLTIQGGEMG